MENKNLGHFMCRYCWWKKSCTTWDLQNPVNNGINHRLSGAGFLPSTVSIIFSSKWHAICTQTDPMTWEEELAKVQTIPKEDRGSFSMQASIRFWNVQLQQKSQQDQYFFWSQLATSGSGPTDTFLAANQRILPLSSTNLSGKACQFGTVPFLHL